MKECDIKKIKTKEQLQEFVDDVIAGKINFHGNTEHDAKRLEWCLLHLRNRDKTPPKNPRVICDLLRLLYNFCEHDEVLQKMILIITSMASRMQVKLTDYQKNKK